MEKKHDEWPKCDDKTLSVTFRRRTCRFTLKQLSWYRYVSLLVEAEGRCVSYADIGEICSANDAATSDSIRSLKSRVVQKLRAANLHDLAKSIQSANELTRINLERLRATEASRQS